MHKVNYENVELSNYGKTGDYCKTVQMDKAISPRQRYSYNNLIDWLQIPDEDETSIVHGDYRLDNMVFNASNNVWVSLTGAFNILDILV